MIAPSVASFAGAYRSKIVDDTPAIIGGLLQPAVFTNRGGYASATLSGRRLNVADSIVGSAGEEAINPLLGIAPAVVRESNNTTEPEIYRPDGTASPQNLSLDLAFEMLGNSKITLLPSASRLVAV